MWALALYWYPEHESVLKFAKDCEEALFLFDEEVREHGYGGQAKYAEYAKKKSGNLERGEEWIFFTEGREENEEGNLEPRNGHSLNG